MDKRILVLDDDVEILVVISYVLQDSGFDVKTLSSGRAIFEEVKQYHPDLVLMDIMLADMDGRVICKALKTTAETQLLPVILISATHNVADTLNQFGAPNDYISKPFDLEYLVSKINAQLSL